MTAAFGAIGTKQTTGTTTVATAYPSGVAAGHMAVAFRVGWTAANIAFAAETGWTQRGSQSGGTGSAADAHTTEIGTDTRELDGSESGSVTFDNGASAGGAVGVMLRYSKSSGETWSVAYSAGDDATHAADRSVTGSSSMSLAPGDIVVAGVAVDTDNALTITSPAITASGITFGTTTRRTSATSGSTSGTDGNVEVFEATVSSGTGTVAPTLAFTTATSQCGPVAFVRLRAVVTTVEVVAPSAGATAASPLPQAILSGQAIERVGTGVVATGTGTTATPEYPVIDGGILSTDYLVMRVATNSSVFPNTLVGWVGARDGSGASLALSTYGKFATGGETGTISVTVPSAAWKAWIDVYRGVNVTTPLDSSFSGDGGSGGSSSVNLTGVTTTVPGVRLAIATATLGSGVTFAAPSSPAAFSEVRTDTASPFSMVGHDLSWASSGATGTVSFTQSGTGAFASSMFPLRPATSSANVAAPAAAGTGAIVAPAVTGSANVTATSAGATAASPLPQAILSGKRIERVGTGVLATGTGTTATPAYPVIDGGILSTDFLVLRVFSDSTTFPTNPGGWGSLFTGTAGGSAPSMLVLKRFAAGGETGTLSVTVPNAAWQAAIDVYRGVYTTTPTDTSATFNSAGGSSTITISSGGLTTNVADDELVVAVAASGAGVTFTPPSSPGAFLEVREDSTTFSSAGFELPWPSSGGTGAITATQSGTGGYVGTILALRPIPAAVITTAPAAGGTGAIVAPAVTGAANVTAPSAAAVGLINPPDIEVPANVTATASGATGAMVAPAITAAVNIAAPAASATGTIEAPLIPQGGTVAAPAAAATGAIVAPTLTVAANVAAPAADATGAMTAPSTFVGTSANVTAPAAAATGAMVAPVLEVTAEVTAPSAAGTGSSTAPTLVAGVVVAVDAASANGTIETPAIQVPVEILAAAGVATASTTAPHLAVLAIIEATAALASGSMSVPDIYGAIRDLTITARLDDRTWSATLDDRPIRATTDNRIWEASLE